MRPDYQRTVLLTGLFLALFFSSLDQTVVGTAMPRIIGELGGLSIMTWVTTAYMLTSTTIVPIAGKLADIYGRRRIYIAGLVTFMLGSALCGTSASMLQLILYRALQGIGGGIMMPLAMTVVGDVFPPEQRGKWQGLMGALFGLSAAVGPTLGGWIVDYASWQWVFYINLPIGLLATLTIYWGLQGEPLRPVPAAIDYAGAAALIAGTVSLLLGLNLGGAYSWLSWPVLSLLAVSVISWVLFVRVERRAADPLLSLALFRNKVFAVTNVVGFLMGLGMFGSLMFLPLFFQGVLGISAAGSGNAMLPMLLAMMLTSVLAGRLAVRLRFRTIYIAGMALMAAAFFLMSGMTMATGSGTAVYYIVILGVGMGLIMPVLTIAVQSAFGAEQRGVATSAAQFFRSIGGTLGMTLLGVLFNAYSVTILQREFFPSLRQLPAGAAAELLARGQDDPHSLFNVLLSPDTLRQIPPQWQEAMLPPLKASLADSLHIVFLAAMLVSLAGVLISLLLGDAGLDSKSGNRLNEAGVVLLAENIAPAPELAAELVPDLLEAQERLDRRR
ncbi:MAG: MDR family MFS transporter [Sporomusaceae bacterium]|nr:MDR family MFS transporter [Sporomusaceae bacterium]